jgi:hypothetical protein
MIDALTSDYSEKKKNKNIKREKWPGGFFPRAGHTLVAVPCRIFVAVRCN